MNTLKLMDVNGKILAKEKTEQGSMIALTEFENNCKALLKTDCLTGYSIVEYEGSQTINVYVY